MTHGADTGQVLTIDNLEISFGALAVVKGVNLSVAPGEILALVGESGSGKSMLGRAIMGLLPGDGRISSGRIAFRNQEVTGALSSAHMRQLRGKEIGLIFQEPLSSLNPNMRVGEQMCEAMRAHTDLSEDEIRERAHEMLRQVRLDNPEQLMNRYPHEFSGGMRQRIMIASVMMLRPSLLIADEPTTALDAVVQKEVLDIIADVARANDTAVILISHDLAVVAAYAAQIAVMEKGVLVEAGNARAVLGCPQHAYTQKLLSAAQLGTPEPVKGVPGAPLLTVEGLQVEFSEKQIFGLFGKNVNRAVKNVSLSVQLGEFVGLAGESGSGKSTIGRAICKLAPMTAGRVTFDGIDLATCSMAEERRLRQRIRVVFQDPFSSLNPRMRVGRIVAEGLRHDRGLSTAERQARVNDLLDAVGLPRAMAGRFPHALSGGQRQRVAIARALISQPDLIIADEPVSALDVTIQAQILMLLKSLQKEFGFACLFISHDLHIVEQLCARLYVLHKGRVMEQGETAQLFATPRHPYTRRLISASPRLERNEEGLQFAQNLPVLDSHDSDSTFYEGSENTADPYHLAEAAPGHFVALRGTA